MDISNSIDNIVEKSKESIKINEGDYLGDDGLWYCGKCHTKKQVRVEIFDKVRTPFCVCKCESEKREKEKEEKERTAFEESVKKLRKTGFPESDMQNWTFSNDDMSNERLTKAMQRYVDNFPELRKQGKGLLLYGQCGTGKTFAACEVANALIDRGYPVLVTNFARLTNTIQGMFDGKQEYIDGLNRFQLIVIDDLSAERDTEFMNEQIFQIVDARYRARLPMIITTNLSIDEIKTANTINKQRVYDRVLERCHPIKVEGGSKRKAKIREEYNSMQELLGLD